jgi:hypothetical protein
VVQSFTIAMYRARKSEVGDVQDILCSLNMGTEMADAVCDWEWGLAGRSEIWCTILKGPRTSSVEMWLKVDAAFGRGFAGPGRVLLWGHVIARTAVTVSRVKVDAT